MNAEQQQAESRLIARQSAALRRMVHECSANRWAGISPRGVGCSCRTLHSATRVSQRARMKDHFRLTAAIIRLGHCHPPSTRSGFAFCERLLGHPEIAF